jgi:hypothetical protein
MIEELKLVHEAEIVDGVPRFTVNKPVENSNKEELVEILGDYEQYEICWATNYEIDCFKVLKRPEGYFIVPFGKVADGPDYEDAPIGPFPTNKLAEAEAIKRLKLEKEQNQEN